MATSSPPPTALAPSAGEPHGLMVAAQARASERLSSSSRGALLGVALCGLTMLSTTWMLLATGWVDGAGGAVVVALAAVFEAAVLGFARVPRIVAALLIPVLALAAIVPATLSSLPYDGQTSLLHLLGRYAAAAFTGLSTTQDWAFLVGLCGLLWICGYWLTWLAVREHRGVPAVLPILIVLATNVLNAKSGHSPGLPTVLSLGFCLIIIANAHLDSLEARWQRTTVQPLPGIRSGVVGSTAVAAVAIMLVGSVLPRATTQDISGRFFSGSGRGDHGGGSGSSSSAPATIGFNDSTTPGGALVSNPVPVLTYTVDTTTPIYLRVVNDTIFRAGNWFPESKSGASYDDNIAFDGVEYAAGQLPRTTPADSSAPSNTATVTARITLQPNATGSADQALFPGDALAVQESGIAYGTVDLHARASSLLTVDWVQLASGIQAGQSLSTEGTISLASAAQLRSAGRDYPAFTARYIALPDDASRGTEVIARLAQQWTAGKTNPYDQAAAIEQHLRSPQFFTYTLTPPAPTGGEWPIVYFLTTSHRGYCQYFASSMGAMLRSLGIPTRLVNGYGPGATLAIGNRQGQRQQQVTTSDAHTWVEAYFPGYGWVPFEPTPPSGQGDYLPIARGGALPAAPGLGTSSDVRPGFNDPSQPSPPAAAHAGTPAPDKPAASAPDPKFIGLMVLAALGLVALLMVLWLMLPSSQRGMWRRLEVVGRLLGLQRRASETHRAYAGRFATAIGGKDAQGMLNSSLAELARASAANEFSRPGTEQVRARRVRRLWLRVLRSTPAVALRMLRRRPLPT